MASEDYTSTPSTGKLKLKGVKESKITKKKKKNKSSVKGDDKPAVGGDVGDNLVVLRKLEDEDEGMEVETKGEGRRKSQEAVDAVEGEGDGDGAGDVGMRVKTDAERRYDEQRRRRLDDRLKREGVKTHKQRVEELNRYLSGLSEHHDMPRIGPG